LLPSSGIISAARGVADTEEDDPMLVSRLGLSPLAALITLTAVTAARAADLPVIIQRPVVQEYSGWYLRGDIGFSNQSVDSLFNVNYDNFDSVQNVDKDFDSAPFFGLGIGYNVNDWLRFDVTGEYRGKANFHGFDIGAIPGGGFADDRYTASKSEWTFLFNGYIDIGTWYKITPFVGAGVGVSRNTISNFGDFSTCTNSLSCAGSGGSDAYGDTASKWSFAWALYAGLAYRLTRNVAIEFAYRYIDLGDAQSGNLIAFDGTNNIDNPMLFNHLTSNDFKIGLRVNLDSFNDYRPVQYAPPPAYEPPPPPPPPLSSRG
jgi:opacity protein-like surface antigen